MPRTAFAISMVLVCLSSAICLPACGRADDIDTSPLPLDIVVAFPNLQWAGWTPEPESGLPVALRPILVTHAGDGSNRVFVPTQHGVVHVLASPDAPRESAVFLDITDRVSYDDKTNEEGFLGLAFHPRYQETGEFYVYYTNRHAPHQNVVARYRVSKDDPNRADRDSEEILLTFDKPFWNHDGGTICFGPDGRLYIAIGDGGAANDPFGNGQKLSTPLGKILRIDIDGRDPGLAYAIPKDNPFVDQKQARPEIWAYGLRNVWRMAFDPVTGLLWAADVGQDTWEEIDLITRGGNYGWNIREGMHPFPKAKGQARGKLIDPIWEYHHDVGKSITGGHVYRGKQIPELEGYYLYADYVAGRLWALKYDPATRRVVANRPIPWPPALPILSFGEDEQGESYFTTHTLTGEGVLRFAPSKRTANK